MEAAWTFMHLELDLYIIMNAAEGNGNETLAIAGGPDSPEASKQHYGQAETTCVEDAQCELQEDGQMRNTLKNRDDCELVYFCGFETNAAGTGREKLMANGGTVWNVFPLACQGTPDRPAQVERSGATHIGNFCEKRWTAEKYIIRSLATGDENEDGVVDYADYRCLYFPDTVGGIPEMTPAAASPDGVWLGAGGDADVDANGDKECGISLLGFESGEEMNAALKMHGSADLSLTQEKALIINKQAVFRLIRLPDF